jgi:ABC-type glycerol-3-phosphate transport system substrate-binding protein
MASLYRHLTNRIHLIFLWITGVLLIITSGCQFGASTAIADPNSSIVELTATARPSRTPTAAISLTSTPTPLSDGSPITLTFWTVEQVSFLREDELGNFFGTSLRLFERGNTDIEVDLLVKKASGKGGVLDFLRTTREVAPSVLPDVVVMDAKDLEQAYAESLIQSLNGRLNRSIVQDLFPAARRMGTVNDELVGVPLGLEMEHTVYNTRIFTDTPMTWTDILSKNTTYLFPAKGVNGLVNDFTLSQYFSAGGKFLDDEGLPKIDDAILKDVLTFYQQARENGTIDASILEAASTEELWPIYLETEAGVAQISVRQYLTDRDLLNSTTFAPLPVRNEADVPVSVIHGWMLVLVTDDFNRQDPALRLIESFLSTANNANWNRINKSIPIRDTAYQQLADDDPYWIFLASQLNTARPEPGFPEYDRISRIIQQAIEQVIRDEETPEGATATAMDALTQ